MRSGGSTCFTRRRFRGTKPSMKSMSSGVSFICLGGEYKSMASAAKAALILRRLRHGFTGSRALTKSKRQNAHRETRAKGARNGGRYIPGRKAATWIPGPRRTAYQKRDPRENFRGNFLGGRSVYISNTSRTHPGKRRWSWPLRFLNFFWAVFCGPNLVASRGEFARGFPRMF
jgi:hypothetical protein